MQTRAAFLDRDGTIIYDRGPATHPRDVKLIPGVREELFRIQNLGYILIVVSNQSGIALGKYDYSAYIDVIEETNRQLCTGLSPVTVTDWFFCPHRPDLSCLCRKPLPGMLLDAKKWHPIDLSQSIMIGDKDSDNIQGIPGLRFFKIEKDKPWHIAL